MSKVVIESHANGTGTSTIKSPNSNADRTLTLPDHNGTLQTQLDQGFSFRNRIINGDMRIDKRNGGVSVTPTDGQYTLDRWRSGLNQASKFSAQQSTAAPTGFTNSLLVTSLSAYSIGVGDLFLMEQRIEGFNFSDFGWGAANAQSVTLSFWVRSSLTGAFGGSLRNADNSRSYPFDYTISTANVWEQKSITIAGDTTGTWVTNNGTGAQVTFGLGVGSDFSGTAGAWVAAAKLSATDTVSLVGTSGATFYITGVQLEAGSVATPFERRPYGTEWSLCERYYQIARQFASESAATNAGTPTVTTNFHTEMRSSPTVVESFIAGGGISAVSYGGTNVRALVILYTIAGTSWYRQGDYLLSSEL